jgi:ADP-ribosylglycohydrolase
MDKAILYDRAVGAFLGLACGDAFGAPLEFVSLPRVRTQARPVNPESFQWTDDTHMSLYLGKAILDLPPKTRDMQWLGSQIASRWVEWLNDPLTPSTAPGTTCMAAARAIEKGVPWKEAAVIRSDGCGAVMRILPVTIAFSGPDLIDAARISAQTTHGHPNASEAAIAGAWITRKLLEGSELSEALVQEAIALIEAQALGGDVAVSLADAVLLGRRATTSMGGGSGSVDWLEEAAVYPGDGGWRSGSALGLAIAAALRWGTNMAKVVEKAARIGGDSDSVACIAGMLVGAQTGRAGVPAAWRQALPKRDEIEVMVGELLHWWDGAKASSKGALELPKAARTSINSPIQVAWIELALPGKIGLTFAPGKKGESYSGSAWDRDLGVDLDRLKALYQVDLLVPLIEDHELIELQIPGLVVEAEARGIMVWRLPIPDGGTVGYELVRPVVKLALAQTRAGKHVVFHCRGGLGRAGTLAACTAIGAGVEPEEAIRLTRVVRPGAIENRAQEAFVRNFRLL